MTNDDLGLRLAFFRARFGDKESAQRIASFLNEQDGIKNDGDIGHWSVRPFNDEYYSLSRIIAKG